jgi:hypothetical protein
VGQVEGAESVGGRQPRRVLLGQLGAAGDCVYATTVARQIKADLPDCHLTWAIGSAYRQVIAHNPHVDEVWEVGLTGHSQMIEVWRNFASEARRRQLRGEFDDVHLTQIFPDNLQNFDGTVRSSIFRGYPRPITVPVTPVVRLTAEEIDRVRAFAQGHGLEPGGRAILFESSPRSAQSPMNDAWVSSMVARLAPSLPGWQFVSASPRRAELSSAQIVDASSLAFREIAELARYCCLLVGCSSGLTWLLTSDAAPPLMPTVQILSARAGDYGAVVRDLEYWQLPSAHVIELRDGNAERAADCVLMLVTKGVTSARSRYHQELPPRFDHYFDLMFAKLRERDLTTVRRSFRTVAARYGIGRVGGGLTPYLVRKLAGRLRPTG